MPSLRRRPPGCHNEDRRVAGCPLREVPAWAWSTLSVWESWRLVGGAPGPGSVEEQEAKQIECFGILSAEMDLIQSHYQEKAESNHRR